VRVRNSTWIAAIAAAGGLVALAAYAPAAMAQRAGASSEEQPQQQTRKTPAMREKVYTVLSKAQECAEMDDMTCAMAELGKVRAMTDLNSYEVAQMWQFYAFIYFNQDQIPQALDAYLNVLKQPDLPVGLENDTMFTIAQLYQATEQYSESLQMLDRWFATAENPGPQAYYLKAVLHYQLNQYREGIEPIQTAIRVGQERGDKPEEGWYQLLNVFYFELEDFPNVIRTLTTLVEMWPKRDYLVQLAGIYGQEGDEQRQLSLFDAAYSGGWLERGGELVTLAQMWMQADAPYKGARILEAGLENGTIESTETNWRTLAQAWQLAQEDERALPAYARASSMSSNGELDVRIAQSYANLAKWKECVDAARSALSRGGLSRADQANLILGQCLFEERLYDEATEAFRAASRDERSRGTAQQWLDYVSSEQTRERELNAMLRRG
jgi:tetratricopeptide (TPR) repeat protein